MPRVWNMRDTNKPAGAVYVGRGRGRRGKWGNPYRIGRDGDRSEVIALYRSYLAERVERGDLDPGELRGRDLVCWCAPATCHADVLLSLANAA